jgi:hypothetical protein
MLGNKLAAGKGAGKHVNHRTPYPKGSKHKPECNHCSMMRLRAAEIGAMAGPMRHNTGCGCAICVPRNKPTQLEATLFALLADFPVVEREVQFGVYRVDAYLPPPYHIAFEADGAHWHAEGNRRDMARDAWLNRKFGLPVVRLTELELRAMA